MNGLNPYDHECPRITPSAPPAVPPEWSTTLHVAAGVLAALFGFFHPFLTFFAIYMGYLFSKQRSNQMPLPPTLLARDERREIPFNTQKVETWTFRWVTHLYKANGRIARYEDQTRQCTRDEAIRRAFQVEAVVHVDDAKHIVTIVPKPN